MSNHGLGILLALLGGILVGNCMLPLKWIRTWSWECTWLVFSLVSLLFVPCLLAILIVPGWPQLYASLDFRQLVPSLIFGFGWGIAQILFGISVVRLGMALAFTVIIGLGTVFGTLIPLVAEHRSELSNSNSMIVIAGCALMLIGIALSGYAGRLRDPPQSRTDRGYWAGLGIAIVSGVLSSMLNLSLAFGRPIAQAAVHRGATASIAAFAVWPIALAGGLAPNLIYSLWLLRKNHSWNQLAHPTQDALLSLLMGLLWIGAVAIYGVSTWYLGRLGDSAGWAIYQIAMVLMANTGGVLAGEWKSASRRSVAILGSGVLTLVAATVTMAISTR